MTSDTEELLRRVPSMLWRCLPLGLVCGLATVVLFAFAPLIARAAPIALPAAIGLPAFVVAGMLVSRIHGSVFDVPVPRARGVLWRSFAVGVVPVALTVLAMAGGLASPRGGAFFQLAGLVSLIAAIVAALLAVVALPVAQLRQEARLSAVWYVAFYATVRTPLPAIGVACAAGAMVWAGSTYAPAVLVAVPLVAAVVGVAASWTTVQRAGVDLPPLLPRASPVSSSAPRRVGARRARRA